MALMISISGIRGVVGPELTPETVVKYSSAFAEYCNRGPVILGRDGRATGKLLGNIISSTLLAAGCDVIALGICPTPTVQLAVEKAKVPGGISVTASHNPVEWNGMKFIASSGLFLNAGENRKLWALADNPVRIYAAWDRQGKHVSDPSFLDLHIREVLSLPYINSTSIKRKKFKVVVDAVNGAGGIVIPKLLRELDCTVVEMNCDASGIFAHTPEPIPENLGDLCARVKQERADLGIAVDPDADRLVLINEKGEPLGEEYTIATVVNFVLGKEASSSKKTKGKSSPPYTIVVNQSTTRAIDDIAKHYGAEVVRTPVGEINVTGAMKELNALIGGEGSGGVILPKLHLGRDSLVGTALVMQALADFDGPISEFKKTLPQYEITKGRITLGTMNANDRLRQVIDRYAKNGRISNMDGVKIDFPHSWVHLRKSNTEPIIRIIAEAPTKPEANSLVKKFQDEILRNH
ncbi:MAG: phosphoglucosamine mutase [Ignavibacteriae bacterium]|nr:phosphoglucosamine mutase [Ignavibacteriota bacterium]